jgi:hypothetical protein
MKHIFWILGFILIFNHTQAQERNGETGAWYMYYWQWKTESKWGLQGDLQSRNWDAGADMEQIMLRGGVTFTPASGVLLTQGYGHIISGAMGESKAVSHEERLYQEALLNHQPMNRIFLKHRFRFEQRWVHNQDFRTRYRYALFANIPLNKSKMERKTIYLAMYNEVFINGQRKIGDGRSVELFDRNRAYVALGYGLFDHVNVQLGYMRQTTATMSKGQVQVSLHQTL